MKIASLHTQLEWCTNAQAILGVVLLAVLGGFYLFGYRPNSTRLANLQMEIDHKRTALLNNSAQVKVLPEVILAVNELKGRLDKYDKQLPRALELDHFIKDISTMARSAQLEKISYKPAPMPIRSELFAEQPVLFKFEGDFLKVFSFLRQTEEMQRLTRVRQLSIHSLDDGKSGDVEVELSMNIYYSEG
jgi:Tfp pilus assembly protein PilO